jgi:guanylate kinase
MAAKGHLFIISGPSGAGKSTILGTILGKRPQLRYSISYTTRLPRGNEQDGVDYHFISEVAFRKKIEAGELAEWAEVHGRLYGTSATYLEEALAVGQDVLLDIDVQEAISVFVAAPDRAELRKRLMKRGTDSPEAVERRLKDAEKEMTQAHLYDHVLVNDDLNQTVSRLEAILYEK